MPKIGGCYEVPIKNSASRTLVTLSFTVHAQGMETEMKLLYETVQSNTHSCAINATIVKLLVVAFLKSRLCFDLKLWPQIRGPDQIWYDQVFLYPPIHLKSSVTPVQSCSSSASR